MEKKVVALIHATIQSTQPISNAFAKIDSSISLLHFLDEGLLYMLKKEGELSYQNTRRLFHLIEKAEECNVDCIQLTCSAFNHLVETFQPQFKTKIFRSDEAMLDEALQFSRVGIVSTVAQTPPVLSSYLKKRKPDLQIKSLVDEEAFLELGRGNTREHDERIFDLAFRLESEVDCLILSQYSMSHVKELMDGKIRIPVLSASLASATRCKTFLESDVG